MTNSNRNHLERMVVSRKQTALMLDSTKWANDFTWDEIYQLAEYVDAYQCRKGTVLLEQGQSDQKMMIILSGKVDVMKRRSETESQHLATLKAGQTLGEMSIVDKEPRSAMAYAKTGVKFLSLTKENLDQLATNHPALAYAFQCKISRMLSKRLRLASGMLVELNNLDA